MTSTDYVPLAVTAALVGEATRVRGDFRECWVNSSAGISGS